MAESKRSQYLNQLASTLPVSNQRVATQMKAGRDIALQSQVAKAPQSANVNAVAQQLGTQVAATAGAQTLENAQSQMKANAAVGQMGLEQQQLENQQRVQERQLAIAERSRQLENKLNQLSREAKAKLFDEQLSFKRDELGQTLWNERQLLDWAVTKAQNREEFMNYEQKVRQLSHRKLKMYEVAIKKLEQEIEQRYKKRDHELDQALMLKLEAAKNALERKRAREKARAEGRAMAWQGGGQIVGGVIGAIFGGPAGAMGGSKAGGGIGQIAGGFGA